MPEAPVVGNIGDPGGEGGEFFASFDNRLDNRGLPGSSTDIGPGWAYAAATPLRLFKGYVAQGGIQVPAVVKYPERVAASRVLFLGRRPARKHSKSQLPGVNSAWAVFTDQAP